MDDVISFPVVRPRSGPVDDVAIRGHSRRRILDALHDLHMEAEAGTTERLIVQLLACGLSGAWQPEYARRAADRS
jgi:hypothetical protein